MPHNTAEAAVRTPAPTMAPPSQQQAKAGR